MKFECGDLDRALAVPELMNEAREHLKECAACRRELRLWNEISDSAKQLHEEWETPELWPRIRQDLAAQPRPHAKRWGDWRVWALAATVVLASFLLFWLNRARPAESASARNRDFLTDQ